MDPKRIGRYRLTARLGAGGMAVVYLGVAKDGSLVAIKVPRPELADDVGFRKRFAREVSALTRVKSVCTVRVIEADTESSRPFMVTEYADGPSLAEYVEERGPLSAEMLYGLATGLAEALTVIHAAGIVHRDLKPSNVILNISGPKVIDFGIAQMLDATAVTKTGIMIGSPGYMAPEQVLGRPGPAADIFAWALTIGYAAAGESPFGSGPTDAVLYRVLHSEPDTARVPEVLQPLVEAALAKDPGDRPAAHELLDWLTSAFTPARPAIRPEGMSDSPTEAVLALTWQTGPLPSRPAVTGADRPMMKGSVLLQPAPPGAGPPKARRPGARKGPLGPRPALIGVAALVVAAAVLLSVTLLTSHGSKAGPLAANQGSLAGQNASATARWPTYPGQQQRGVFQTISRIVASGDTMVTTGSQTSDGLVRQQFFASPDSGATWHLAPVQTPGGGQPPLGEVATRIAGGPDGWMAEGPQAIWTSRNGLSWTLAATHGISPQLPGDGIDVVTGTADGFLAAGAGKASGGGSQAVIWVSRDGISWQRVTAAQLGLTASGQTPTDINYATSRGNDTVISNDVSGVWLSTDGGSAWTPVTVPVDHGAQNQISGLSFDGSGLIAVRPGATGSGAPDGVAYFSPNGQTWRFAGIIDPAGGWRPGVVKGSNHGFVVTGTTTQNTYVAYTSTGTGTSWMPTGSLGATSGGPVPAVTVGPGGTVIAVGSTNSTNIGQHAVFLKANTAGKVSPVSLSNITGGLIPEEAVKDTAIADGEQIAVGSANGYPAVWRRPSHASSWTLVSPLSLVSGFPGLAALSSVTHGSAGWVATGTPGPVIFTSADGVNWRRAGGNIQQDLAGVAVVTAASGPTGYLIDGTLVASGGAGVADGWFSANLTSWTRAHTAGPPTGSSQVLAVAGGPHGFVTVGSHNGQPAVWITANGTLWTIDVLPLPTGASAGVLQQVAIIGTSVVALGQQTTAAGTMPLAELSSDGGTTWRQVQFTSAGPNMAFTALTARSGGFTAAGQFGAVGRQSAAVWTSTNGANWRRLPVNGLTGGGNHDITTLAPSGSAVTGIDTIQAQSSQENIGLLLPAQ